MTRLDPPEPGRRFGSGGRTLGDVGEMALLEMLGRIAAEASVPRLVLGPGDDAAVWAPPPGREVALSQDALVEERDFRRPWLTPRSLGRRAFHVAASDIAGMGGELAWCMATLCAPADTEVHDVLEIQSGLVGAAAEHGCAVAGGDVSDTPGPLVIDVSVAGTSAPGLWLRRSGGKPGDLLYVTGVLGAAAAGLEVLREAGRVPAPGDPRRAWVDAFLEPRARLAEGRRLVELGVRCGGDLSDGLALDAGRTATSASCRAELWLDRIPLPEGVRQAFPGSWMGLALAGGEDFELLAAVPSQAAPGLLHAWPAGLAPLRQVGRLVAGGGVGLLDREGGAELALPAARSLHWQRP